MTEADETIVIREVFPDKHPIIHSQVLNLRNQLLRQPIGLDLFQEDLSQEKNHVTLAATITTKTTTLTATEEEAAVAKSDDCNVISSLSLREGASRDIDSISNEEGVQEERVVGCIMLAPMNSEDETTMKIRQMAVSPEFQGRGLGSMLVSKAEETAKARGKTRLYVHGRVHAVGFYLKNGFSKVNQEQILELGIPHYALEKSI